MSRMECSITDGPQTPEEMLGYGEPLEDEDAAYEETRQIEIDAATFDALAIRDQVYDGPEEPPMCCDPTELAEIAVERERPDD